MNRIVTTSVIALAGIVLAGAVSAAEILYKDGAWTWENGSWEGGVKPGQEDTAVIPELPVLKTRYTSGKMQSNSLVADEEIGSLHFMDLYGLAVNGQYRLTLKDVVCGDMDPKAEDVAQVATNRLAMLSMSFKGVTNELYVGRRHVLDLAANTIDRAEGSMLIKTGAGVLIHSGVNWGSVSAPVWVQEGEYYRTGNGYPSMRGDVIVGGCGADAMVRVSPSAAQSFILPAGVLDIRPRGTLQLPEVGVYYYHETLKIDHGVLDGSGSTTFCMSNAKETECGPEYTFDAGVVTNGGIVVAAGGTLTIRPSDRMSAIYGKLQFNTAYDIDVPDGVAPVDFLVAGEFEGANRGVHKKGDGTMVIRCRESIATWSGLAGKDLEVNGGALYFESFETDGIGMGTNDVVVKAGSTYGAVGRHIGGEAAGRGWFGDVIVSGEAGKTTTFVVGKIDETTGALKPGRYSVGSEASQLGDVKFNGGGCTLKMVASSEAVSHLSVAGSLRLSGDDTLDIVGPEDAGELQSGLFEIVKAGSAIDAPLKAVTYNGGPLPWNLRVRVRESRIELRVSKKGMKLVVR